MKMFPMTVVRTILVPCVLAASSLAAQGQDSAKKAIAPSGDSQQEVIKAWSEVDKQSVPAIEKFIAKYGDTKSKLVNDAGLFLSLAKKVQAVKSGMAKPNFVIPIGKLPDKWTRWKKEYPYGGAVAVVHTDRGDTLSLPPGCQARFDNVGRPTLPTNDGSILIFESRVESPKWTDMAEVFLGGYLIAAQGKDPIYFAVVDSLGLVHLQGACTVTTPDKTTTEIKREMGEHSEKTPSASTQATTVVGEWKANPVAGYTATFADDAGNTVVGTFRQGVSWQTNDNGGVTLRTWDDGATFVVQAEKEPEGKRDFKVPNRIVKARIIALDSKKTGTLGSNIKAVFALGKVNYNGQTFTRLETSDGEYTIVWDDQGQRLSKELNGKTVEVKGLLTGRVGYDMTSSLSSPFSGTVSSVVEVPYLAVLSFKQVEK